MLLACGVVISPIKAVLSGRIESLGCLSIKSQSGVLCNFHAPMSGNAWLISGGKNGNYFLASMPALFVFV